MNLQAGNLLFGGSARRIFDIAPAGRFLMVKQGGDDSPASQNLVVIPNWLLARGVETPRTDELIWKDRCQAR